VAIRDIQHSMRLFLAVLVISAIALGAPDAENDKKTIESLIAEFNSATAVGDLNRLLVLFAKDGDYGRNGSSPVAAETAIRQAPAKKLPWDERMPLTMKVQKIQFIRTDVALADAIQSDSSPIGGDSRNWSCTFVFVSTNQEWKIVSYRESLIRRENRR
jgi:uncharacterized protein (TIGR02246 family)